MRALVIALSTGLLLSAASEALACSDAGVCSFSLPERVPSGGSLFGECGGGAAPTALVVNGSTIALTVVRHEPTVFEAYIPDLPPGTTGTLTVEGRERRAIVIVARDDLAPVLSDPPALSLMRVAAGGCTSGGLRLRIDAPQPVTGEPLGMWIYGFPGGSLRSLTSARSGLDLAVDDGQQVCVVVEGVDLGRNRSNVSPRACLTIDAAELPPPTASAESCASLGTSSLGALLAVALVALRLCRPVP